MPQAKSGIRPLGYSDKDAFCKVMTLAFQDDPLFVRTFPEAKTRAQQLRNLHTFIFDKGKLFEEQIMGYFSDHQLKGVYVLQTPHPVSLWQNLRLALRSSRLPLQLPWSSLKFLNDYMRLITALRPDSPHYYLNMIAVHPLAQGQGIAKVMLEHILHIVDTDPKAPCIQLDTSNPDNPAFYQHFGFQLKTVRNLQGVCLYLLLRKSVV